MSILLVSHLFKREIGGGKFKALLLWLLPYVYLLTFVGMASFAVIKFIDIDSLEPKAVSLLLALVCGLSLIASYASLARIARIIPAPNIADVDTGESLRVSWKIYETICFSPILILAVLSVVSFIRS